MAVQRTGTGELLCGQSSSTPMPHHSTINAFKVHKCIQSMHFIQFVVLDYVTGLTVIHRAREVLLVPGGGKWRLKASMFLFLEACSKFSEHGRPRFPRGTTNVKMKSCVTNIGAILVLKDSSMFIFLMFKSFLRT